MAKNTLWKDVLGNSKKSYNARVDENNKPVKNVANFGLPKNGVAVRMGEGEYTNFTVKVLEKVKPLMTNVRVSKAIKFLSKNDIQSAIRVLNLDDEVQDEGLGILYEVLRIWLEKNEFPVPEEYLTKAKPIKSTKLKKWILLKRPEPIQVRIKIIGVGRSKKGNSVVPEDWLNREFANAEELHQEMDKLDWRKGKPPVNYCCIHSMAIKDIYTWQDNVTKFKAEIGISILIKNGKLVCNVNKFSNKWLSKMSKLKQIKFLPGITKTGKKVIIAAHLSQLTRKPKYKKTESVGILVSRLQKCIRRGRACSQLLEDTVRKLAEAPQYNLPDQQFARVSGSRQLVWRLFITTLEDVEPYLDGNGYLGLLDLACLALMTQLDPNLQLDKKIVDQVLYTALLIQYNDKPGHCWNWRKGKEREVNNEFYGNPIKDSMLLALMCMPMMRGDNRLLRKGLDYLDKIELDRLEQVSIKKMLLHSDPKKENLCWLASYDMHCLPNILIQLQAAFPFIPYDKKHTTKQLSGFIWDNSSRINVRRTDIKIASDRKSKMILSSLVAIQKKIGACISNESVKGFVKKGKNRLLDGRIPTELEARTAFLLIFGKKVRLPSEGGKRALEVVVAGTEEKPCKVKRPMANKTEYLDGKERFLGELRYVEVMNDGMDIVLPKPPPGFKWIFGKKKFINIRVVLKKSDNKTWTNELGFYVDDIAVEPFDASLLLVPIGLPKERVMRKSLIPLINQALYIHGDYTFDEWELNIVMRKIGEVRRNEEDSIIHRWIRYAEKSPITAEIWKNIIVKMNNCYNNEVQIGPVDRSGKKLNESINYLYEGTIMRIFNFLSMLYPTCVIPKGGFKYTIKKNTSGYLHLMKCLDRLAFVFNDNKVVSSNKKATITTKLWAHQKEASGRITNGMIQLGKKGFGDASNVGAGKTLTALAVMKNILENNIKNKVTNYKGFLVLLPTTKLYKTWEDEIRKHTKGFIINKQSANGLLEDNIQPNTIVITTLGRCRDHPLSNSWQLVIIDECLSVQNKNALQTEEAWRQVICSQHGVMMMSATFFRSRFDKLFYMLKMLRSGLPEEKDYLDTILSECIVCCISSKSRKWITNVNKFKLSASMRKRYDEMRDENTASDKLYALLSKFLYDNFNYIRCFKKILDNLSKKKKALIYTRSKNEADELAEKVDSVTRYPDKTGRHVVVSYAEGTYGLNDLVGYSVIVTRPPEPDKLPQMKGRLDRPGQKEEVLEIQYLLAEDTIEEAWLFRLEMANNFYYNHIIPLATFYDMAVGRKQIKI